MPRIAAHREPFSRGEKLLFGALPLGAIGFVLSALWITRADDVPLIAFPAPAPLPNPNGFALYVAAARSIRSAKPAVDPIDDPRAGLGISNPQQAAKDYSLARRAAWLSANSASFALVKRATATPSRYDPALGSGIYAPLRQLARSKVIEANTFVLQRRWSAATQGCLDTIQMGQDIARGGPLIAKMVGSALIAIGRDPLFTDKNVPEHLTAPQARAAARRLETMLAARPSWKDALERGKWDNLADFLGLVKAGHWRSLANQSALSMGGAPLSWRERLSLQFLTPGEVLRRIRNDADRSIANIQKPYRLAIPYTPPLDPYSGAFGWDRDFRFNEGREIVPFNILLLRFALRAYRLDNGRFPASLNQLAPRYLKEIPTDYFASGAPFRFRLKGPSYQLWSVGPDKIDNDGAPIKARSGVAGANPSGRLPSILEDSTGDYVAGKNR